VCVVVLLLARLVDGGPLCDAVVVAAPVDLRPLGKAQNALDRLSVICVRTASMTSTANHIPYLDVATAVVLGPYAEDILAAPHTQHKAADLLACFHELVADEGHQQLLPVAVGDALFQTHDPLATALVLLIFPDRADALFEDMVVGDGGQRRGSLEMDKDFPEVLGSAHPTQRLHRLFIVVVLRRGWAEPDDPCVFQRPWGAGIERRRGSGRGVLWEDSARLSACTVGSLGLGDLLVRGGGRHAGGHVGDGGLEVKGSAGRLGGSRRRAERGKGTGAEAKGGRAADCRRGEGAGGQRGDGVEGIAAAVRGRVAAETLSGGGEGAGGGFLWLIDLGGG
jgi:hypothetical protein